MVTKISVVLLLRNNEEYIKYLHDLFNNILNSHKNYYFEFFIYENDSYDNTKLEIVNFFNNKNGKYLLEDTINDKQYINNTQIKPIQGDNLSQFNELLKCIISAKNGNKYDEKRVILTFPILKKKGVDIERSIYLLWKGEKNLIKLTQGLNKIELSIINRIYLKLTEYSGISLERGKYMSKIRNKLKNFHGILKSDYTLLIDSEVIFNLVTIEKLIQSLVNDIVMVSPFTYYFKDFKKHNVKHYYDTLAFISDNNISYLETGNTCLYKNCKLCKNIRINNKIELDEKFLICRSNNLKVRSCFGSMSLLKTCVYNKIYWGKTICEHHSFCSKILKLGKYILVNNSIEAIMSSNNTFKECKSIQKLLDNSN